MDNPCVTRSNPQPTPKATKAAKAKVTMAYMLHHESNPGHKPYRLELSPNAAKQTIFDALWSKLVKDVQKRHGFALPNSSSVDYYVPNDDLLFSCWKDYDHHFKTSEPSRQDFNLIHDQDIVGESMELDRTDLVHLVVVPLKSGYPSNASPREPTGENQQYVDYVKGGLVSASTGGLSPSVGCSMKLYVGTQKHSETMVHDGLRNSQGPDTSSPYVTAYHPVFQDFIRDLHDPLLPMPPELPAFDDVNVFMDHSAVIAKINEDEVNATLRLRLSRCLGNRVLDAAPGPTKAVPDGWWRARVHGNLLEFPSFIWENKLGLGDGGGDAVVQCALSWRRAILDAISKYPECLATKSNCPTFMLATVGSWMCVIGGVFVERLIVQRLTPFLSTAGPELASMGSIRLKQITRVFMCLSRGLYRIERYYEALAGQAISPLNILNVDVPDESHPRNFPYPNSYQGPNGDAIKFEYIRSLHLHPRYRAQCATFLARESSNDYIVVKFVSRGHYGFEAHQLVLDDHNTAPHIRYYGPLPSHTLYGSDSTWTPAGWYAPPLTVFSPTTYSDLEMVVMEYIPSIQSPTLKEIETGLKELAKVIKGLHDKGYVFGDLREPNVIFSPQGVKLIDFDWAGRFDPNATPSNRTSPREDIARYPSRLTTHGIRWPEGAASLSRRPILPNDDDFMYTQLEHALLSRYK